MPIPPSPVPLATAVAARELPEGAFAYEPKLDGWRGCWHGGDQVLHSRSGKNLTARFPELARDERQERLSRKVKFTTYCGTKKVAVVSADGVTGLDPLGQPVAEVLKPPFGIGFGTGGASARMWPLENQPVGTAPKPYASRSGGMVQHGRGDPSDPACPTPRAPRLTPAAARASRRILSGN